MEHSGSFSRAIWYRVVLLAVVLGSASAVGASDPYEKIQDQLAETQPAELHMEEPVKLAIDATSVATLKELLSSRGLVAPIGISEYPLPDGRRVSVTVQPFSLWTTDNEIALLEGESVLHVGSHQAVNQLLGWGGAKDERTRDDPTDDCTERSQGRDLVCASVVEHELLERHFNGRLSAVKSLALRNERGLMTCRRQRWS